MITRSVPDVRSCRGFYSGLKIEPAVKSRPSPLLGPLASKGRALEGWATRPGTRACGRGSAIHAPRPTRSPHPRLKLDSRRLYVTSGALLHSRASMGGLLFS